MFNFGYVPTEFNFQEIEKLAKAEAEKQSSLDSLANQIISQGTTSKWSGEGFGSAEANAKDMAKILSGIGITDIRQFGEIKDPNTGDVVFGNKVTGQVVPNTYSERQTGNAFGGTFAGKGNTGYRVQFSPDGTPVFYTTGASSSDVANLFENPILNLAGSVASAYFGGPLGAAAFELAKGGDIEDIAKSAALAYGAGKLASTVAPEVSEAFGGGTGGNVAASSLTGGTISELMGGDFATGALRGGISSGINDYQEQLRQEQFDTAMTESGLAGQTSVDDIQYPQVADTSIQDVINQISFPVDQSVQSPIGAAEYQDDGVQEITVTAPRYEASPFQYDMQPSIDALLEQLAPYKATALNTDINKLVNDLTGSVPAEPDSQPAPVDNSKLIAALDVAKTLTPVALAALLAKNAIGSQDAEETSGFSIVPVPAEWKSPTYNQSFTPSAQLDFGSPALLAGTQWGKPKTFEAPKEYNISDVINTLNYESVPFVQHQYQMPQQISPSDFASQFQSPTVGTNDIIGNLGGKPVSISDIVAGIQSQYG